MKKWYMKKKTNVIALIIGLVLIVVLIGLLLSSGEKEPQLTLNPDEIVLEWRDNHQTLFTRCHAGNETDKDWEGAVDMNVYNTDGDLIYASLDAGWPKVPVEVGKHLRLGAKIPFDRIRGRYSEDTIVIRWRWGSQKVEQKFKI